MVIAGGTGFLGSCLIDAFKKENWDLHVLTRGASEQKGGVNFVHWNGASISDWARSLEGADAVINLNGKSVDCRYTSKNKALIYSTRLDATHAIGKAIQQCQTPPAVWINASSATIYRHSVVQPMDEYTGEIGSGFSVDVCLKWEAAFNSFKLPSTRKIALRTGIVFGKLGGPLSPLVWLAKLGVGGHQGNGSQYFSWLHAKDFCEIVKFAIENKTMSGAFNATSPTPIPNKQLMKELRAVLRIPFGVPLPKWLLELGAIFIRTETELVLKSRYVIPRKLEEAGYTFQFRTIREALNDLVGRSTQ